MNWSRTVVVQPLRLGAFLCRAGPQLRVGASAASWTSKNLNVQRTTAAAELKSIDDLPGPSASTTLYWMFVKGYADKAHLLQVKDSKHFRLSVAC